MPKKSGRDKKTHKRITSNSPAISRKTYSDIVKTPRSFNELLERTPLTSRIARHVSAQKSWTDWLRERVPPDLSTHIVSAVPRESELVVFADTSAWSVRLRYAAQGLLAAIRERDPAITHTRIRVHLPSRRLP